MDFIVELPLYDVIYVCVDRLIKMAHFCPMNSNGTAEQMSQLYLQHVFEAPWFAGAHCIKQGEYSSRRRLELCKIKGNRSAAYHPESDGPSNE